MSSPTWPPDWLRGPLTVAVLGALRHGPTYGYKISATLEQAGLGAVKGGTLYPLLGRLERDGLVAATWVAGESGPGRKYFALTPIGLARLDELAALWTDFSERVTALALTHAAPQEA